MKTIASEKILFESLEPGRIFCYSPGLAALQEGRIIATFEIAAALDKQKSSFRSSSMVYFSDDNGLSWEKCAEFDMEMPRPFVSGNDLYLIGHKGDLNIARSDDGGRSWTELSPLTNGEKWHQSSCNFVSDGKHVRMALEKHIYFDVAGWPVSALSPVLLKGKIGADLLKRENWTFSEEKAFRDLIDSRDLDYFGIPFYSTPEKESAYPFPGRECAPMGWLEGNVVKISDPDHYWHDDSSHHIFLRAHTGSSGYAAVIKAVEKADGTIRLEMQKAPSGKNTLFVPCPGGHLKFHIIKDPETKLFWLLSSQSTDSMTRAESLPEDRYNLPNNERNRLQLHFSTNCVDWLYAGLVAAGKTSRESRNYASMVINGNDLHVLSRSGNSYAESAHNGNLITHHIVKDFRDYAY
jgi:hypothetical protein